MNRNDFLSLSKLRCWVATIIICLFPTAAMLAAGCGTETDTDDTGQPDSGTDDDPRVDSGAEDATVDAGETAISLVPGSACNCNDDCQGDPEHPGVCIMGICMTMASSSCSSPGSRAECGQGLSCWEMSIAPGVGICWPDCSTFDCVGTCDQDNSCVFDETNTCDPACAALCPADTSACTSDNPGGFCDEADQVCVAGACETLCSAENKQGYCSPQATCRDGACRSAEGCPDWQCHGADCAQIIEMPGSFDPDSQQANDDGYYIATWESYAYLRRDLIMLLQYAACEVSARFPQTPPLGISDMTQADGQTPGTDLENIRHPAGTHTGNDVDCAYYQTDGANQPQIICGDGSDTNENESPGRHNDGYACTTEENIIDWSRQAYFFAKMSVSEMTRVYGVDQTLEDDFIEHIDNLLLEGEISQPEHDRALRLGIDVEKGWHFHHHHSHMSFCPVGSIGPECKSIAPTNFPE